MIHLLIKICCFFEACENDILRINVVSTSMKIWYVRMFKLIRIFPHLYSSFIEKFSFSLIGNIKCMTYIRIFYFMYVCRLSIKLMFLFNLWEFEWLIDVLFTPKHGIMMCTDVLFHLCTSLYLFLYFKCINEGYISSCNSHYHMSLCAFNIWGCFFFMW